MIKPVTDQNEILKDISKYLFLKRKRLFYLDGFDDVDGMQYGYGEQSDFTVVFTPDRFETQYPVGDVYVRNIKSDIPPMTDYKYEYFPLTDKKVQSSINDKDIETINTISAKFISVTENWLGES